MFLVFFTFLKWRFAIRVLRPLTKSGSDRTGSDRIGMTKPGSDRTGLTKPGSGRILLTETHIHSLKVDAFQIPIKDDEERSRK